MIGKLTFETQDNKETQQFLLDNNHIRNELIATPISDILASRGTTVHKPRNQLSWYINDAFLFGNPLTRILGETQFPALLTEGVY